MSTTDSVSIIRNGDKFKVSAYGGYDGCVLRDFDTVEEMLEFVEYLWSL